jgi:hypothetical protein
MLVLVYRTTCVTSQEAIICTSICRHDSSEATYQFHFISPFQDVDTCSICLLVVSRCISSLNTIFVSCVIQFGSRILHQSQEYCFSHITFRQTQQHEAGCKFLDFSCWNTIRSPCTGLFLVLRFFLHWSVSVLKVTSRRRFLYAVGAFVKFKKETIKFAMSALPVFNCFYSSVWPSVRIEQFGSGWTNFSEILYWRYYKNLSRKLKCG